MKASTAPSTYVEPVPQLREASAAEAADPILQPLVTETARLLDTARTSAWPEAHSFTIRAGKLQGRLDQLLVPEDLSAEALRELLIELGDVAIAAKGLEKEVAVCPLVRIAAAADGVHKASTAVRDGYKDRATSTLDLVKERMRHVLLALRQASATEALEHLARAYQVATEQRDRQVAALRSMSRHDEAEALAERPIRPALPAAPATFPALQGITLKLRASVRVTDQTALDPRYTKTIEVADLDALQRDLEAGVVIDGAELDLTFDITVRG